MMGTWQDPWAIDVPLLLAEELAYSCEAADGWDIEDGPCGLPAVGWRLDPEELCISDSLTPFPVCMTHA